MESIINEMNDAKLISADLLNNGESLVYIVKCLNEVFPNRYYLHGTSIYMMVNDREFLILKDEGACDAYRIN